MPQPSAPSSSPWLRVLAAASAAAVIGASIVLSTTPVSAAGLEAFASCGALQAHLEQAAASYGYGVARDDVATGDAVAPTTSGAAPEAAGADESSAQDGTNTQVAGVDELDLVDVLADGRILAAREDRVVLIAAAGDRILASLPVPPTPQLTFDDEASVLWVVSTDWMATTLTRSVLEGDSFGSTTTWSVAGRLVDLRRDSDTVHLVVVDDEVVPVPGPAIEDSEEGPASGAPASTVALEASDPSLPFGGTSPVPCDEVLHSPLPGGPATTLVATFSSTGALTPTAATEIVGAGDNVLVTASALYVSTPTYDGDQPVTGIHRFDVDDLTLTGSGSVAGRLLNQFSLDEHAGHLRAAVTIGDGGFLGQPMPVEGDVGVAVDGAAGDGTGTETPAAAPETATTEPAPPTTVEPTTSTTSTDTTTSTEPTTTSTIEPPTTTETPTTSTSAPVPVPTVVTVAPSPGALNEIVTFDLDGPLDVVGRSPRFGHDGETLQGIRFAGEVAYAVTFLQTDPLYVIDLSDPAAPKVLGQLEIPGFSAYLHPISATQVIGFGPSGDGQVLARLFDVSDPSVPRLLDTVAIAVDSPIVYDHHALRSDGDRLIVAANDWVAERPERCGPVAEAQARLEGLYLQIEAAYRDLEGRPIEQIPPELEALQREADELAACAYPSTFPQARIVTLTPAGSSLGLAATSTEAGEAQRVLPLADGYLVVGPEITKVSPAGTTVTTLGEL